jgi:hypothetical protein
VQSPLESAAFRLAGLYRLAPPYNALGVWNQNGADCAPLGTIVHASGPSALAVLGSVTLSLRLYPWLVPIVTFPPDEGQLEPLIELVGELRGRAAVLQPGAAARMGTAPALIVAATRRPPPPPEVLSAYATSRVTAVDLHEPLAEQFRLAFEDSLVPSRSVATYSRLFARHGPFTARDWRALARLTHDQCVRQSGAWPKAKEWMQGGTTDTMPLTLNRTAEHYARHLLGMSLRAAGERLGWEWVLEYAIRRAGYIRPVRPPRQALTPGARPEHCVRARLATLHH